MKIRMFFVSNSSSSSFAILGIVVDKKIREKAHELAKAKLKDKYYEDECDSEIFDAIGLSYYSDTEYGTVCGVSVDGDNLDNFIKDHKKIVDMFGDIAPYIMSGEYEC